MTCIWRPPLYGGHFCQVPRVAAIDRFDCIYIYIYIYIYIVCVCVCACACVCVCVCVCVTLNNRGDSVLASTFHTSLIKHSC